MTTLSPEQITCAVEMYRDGNAPRFTMGGLAPLLTTGLLETTCAGMRLNPAGCTLAKMAIALEQAMESARAGWEVGDGVPQSLRRLEGEVKEFLG